MRLFDPWPVDTAETNMSKFRRCHFFFWNSKIAACKINEISYVQIKVG